MKKMTLSSVLLRFAPLIVFASPFLIGRIVPVPLFGNALEIPLEESFKNSHLALVPTTPPLPSPWQGEGVSPLNPLGRQAKSKGGLRGVMQSFEQYSFASERSEKNRFEQFWGHTAMAAPAVTGLKQFFDQDDDDDPLIAQLNGILKRIFDQDGDDEPLTSRGNGFCVLAPALDGAETSVIWSDRPVLVWQADSVGKLGLRQANSSTDFWSHVPTAGQTHVTYDGAKLQPGETYELAIYLDAVAPEPTAIPEFQIVAGDEGRGDRQSITEDLTTLAQPKPEGISHTEWFAIQRANYFANHDWPIDAVQALFSVSRPSAQLLATQQTMIETACETDN